MAEVGVLELQIHDNSEKAASGLDNLANALTRVQNALGNGLKLGNTANQIEKLVTKMQTAIPEESISRLERLAKAVETLNRAGGINLSGIKGLSREFNANVSEIKASTERVAEDIKTGFMSGANRQLSETKELIDKSFESFGSARQETDAMEKSLDAAASNAERLRDAVAEVQSYARLGSGGTPLRLGSGGVSPENMLSTWVDFSKQWQTGWTDGSDFHPGWEIKEEFDEASAAVYRFAQEMDSAIRKATELKTLMSGGSPLLLGAGGVSNENALSTWVDFSQQWQTGWTNGNNFAPLWTMAEGFDEVSAGIYRFATAMDEAIKKTTQFMALASGQPIPLLGAGNAGMELSTWVDRSRQWAPNWTSGQQPRLGSGNPDWIFGDGTVSETYETVETVKSAAQEVEASVEEVSKTAQAAQSEIIGYMRVWNDVTRQWESVGYTAEFLKDRIASVAASANNASPDGMKDSFERTNSTVEELKSKVKDLVWLIKDATGGAEGLRSGFQRIVAPITNVVKQFNKLARYRVLRAVIKQIAEGFKEGVENYYHYSEAVNNGFSAAMDGATTSLLTFKNSIGAAVAPLIQALIPILQQVVTWVVTAINYVNQFIALLSGKTSWSKAIDTTAKAFENTKKNAGGASKAIKEADNNVKDLLADFDELNIIQSQTGDNGGSGGGGGGGGSGKTATDYKKMFTEVSKFSDEIKTVVDVIKNGFGDAWELVKLIGTAILGWKISKSFEGILGKLGSLTAGLTISIIGLKLSYGSGVDIGQNGFNKTNVLTLVAGSIASALGGGMVAKALGFSSTTGILIGVTASLLISLVGYIKGQQDSADALKWGSKTMTPEQIEKLVKSQFKFDVDSEIRILSTVITNEEKAREELDSKIIAFKQSLTDANIAVGLTVDKSDDAPSVIKAADDARAAIQAVNNLIDASHDAVKTTLKILPPVSGDGEDILENLSIADTTLKSYFNDMGQKIAGYIYEGQRTGWVNGEMEQAISLMESEQRILDRAEELKNDNELLINAKAQTKSVVKNGVFDKETAQSVLEQQKAALSEYITTATQQAQAKADSYINLWSIATASAEEAEREGKTETAAALKSSAQTYLDLANSTLDEMSTKIEGKVAETKKTIAGYWAEILPTVYGQDYENQAGMATSGISYDIFGLYQTEDSFSKGLREAFANGGSKSAGQWLLKNLNDSIGLTGSNVHTDWDWDFGSIDPGITKDVIETFGLSAFDVISDEMKTQILERLISTTGNKDDAIEIFKAATGLSDIEKYLPEEAEKIAEGMDFSSIADAFANIDWQHMADDEFDSFLLALKEKFGSEELSNFLNSGDIDIPAGDIRIPLDVTLEETVTGVEGDDYFDYGELERKWWTTTWEDFNLGGSNSGFRPFNPNQLIASAGMSGFGGGHGYGEQTPEETAAGVQAGTVAIQTDLQTGMANRQGDIQSGVQAGTGSLLTALNSILSVAQAINNKNFTVNITPSTTFGIVTRRSGQGLSRVTGNLEVPT